MGGQLLYMGLSFTRFTVGLERRPQGPGPPFNTSEENGRNTRVYRGFNGVFRTLIPVIPGLFWDIPVRKVLSIGLYPGV